MCGLPQNMVWGAVRAYAGGRWCVGRVRAEVTSAASPNHPELLTHICTMFWVAWAFAATKVAAAMTAAEAWGVGAGGVR